MAMPLSKQVLLLGYELIRYKTDNLGHKHPYATAPFMKAGGINYFPDKEAVERWVNQVNEIRKMQHGSDEAMTLLDFMRNRKGE